MEEENRGCGARCAESFRSFGRFLYNSETKQVLGRSGKSWALIGLFYLVFYSALAGFFAGMLAVFLNVVIETNKPKLTGKQSLLKLTPGLSFFPLPNYKSTLIRFKEDDALSYEKYTADITKKLENIKNTALKPTANYATCDATTDKKTPNKPMDVCQFQMENLGNCRKDDYGFKVGKPCIFVKMNKVYGWIPDVQDNTDNPYIFCEGETPADRENIGGLDYFPSVQVDNSTYAKISNIYFPYLNQKDYVAPVAAIQFTSLKKNVMVMVRCYLRGLKDNTLSVRLEILMD